MVRAQANQIIKDLEKKMVILVGPRQVGKTWLCREVSKQFKNALYINYDNCHDRELMIKEGWLPDTDLLIFDEIHKMPHWQSFVKGIYDTRNSSMKMLVTGSARMDLLSHTGESLAGRYFRHCLLPFSLSELHQTGAGDTCEKLLVRGGFPEPLLSDNQTDADRWRKQYLDGIIRYDILDLSRYVDFKALQLTVDLLRQRVGSPFSASSIARDVGASPTTILKYVSYLEALFVIFRVTPFSHNIARSLLKEPKVYFYDTGLVTADKGAKLENLVAVSLLKDLWARNDCKGESWKLQYIRTKEGNEVDFAIVNGANRVERIIECKLSERTPERNLVYFTKKYSIPGVQLVLNLRNDYREKEIEVRSCESYLRGLFI